MNQAIIPSKHFYEELNLLRGVTIVFIVFGHFNNILKGAGSAFYHIWELFAGGFVIGGSWFFVFISGFLFHAIFYQRGLIYKRFIGHKIQKVFLPYLIFATAFLILEYLMNRPDHITAKYIINAYFYWSFWYVPFIMCIFFMTPGFELFITFHPYLRIFIFILSLVVAIGAGRHNTNPLLSCVYFIPGYLLGIISSLHYTQIITTAIKVRWTLFFVFLLLLASFVGAGHTWESNFSTWSFKFFERPSYIIIVKLAFCLFFVWSLRWLVSKNLSIIQVPLNLLAKYSFTIFFFHPFFIFFMEKYPQYTAPLKSLPFFPRLFFIFAVTVGACFLIILIFAPLKKFLGKYSRMIIGS